MIAAAKRADKKHVSYGFEQEPAGIWTGLRGTLRDWREEVG